MKLLSAAFLFFVLIGSNLEAFDQAAKDNKVQAEHPTISGFRDVAGEREVETKFLAVPDPKLAEEHLRVLTQAPHIAGSPEDKATADYVAKKFRDAGLDTEIVEYKVWLNYPTEIRVDLTAPDGVEMHGPRREHVDGDSFADDPRVVTAYNGMSPSGDAEAEVVYANYGSPADFDKLKEMNVDVRGKIVIVRYGENFRGVKEFVAQERGAAAVIIYSDPKDDGYYRGDAYQLRREWRLLRLCRMPNAWLPPHPSNCRRFPRLRFPTPTPRRFSSTSAGHSHRANGRERCPLPTTLVPVPRK